jgi:transposase-like protein
VRKAEVDAGKRAGVMSDMSAKLKALERENRELRQANEILRKASAYFAPFSANASIRLPGRQPELDRRAKT